MADMYIEIDGKPVLCASIKEWNTWFTNNNTRKIDYTYFEDCYVSTVFLGIDHRFDMKGKPILYETMIFGGKDDGYQKRYTSREEASIGHDQACRLIDPLYKIPPKKKKSRLNNLDIED